jgi:hypothetical protein
MRLTYTGSQEAVALPDGQVAEPGAAVTVSADLGAALLDQSDSWAAVTKSTKAAKPESKES